MKSPFSYEMLLLWAGQPGGVKTAERVAHTIGRVRTHSRETQENRAVPVGQE
jgi:hypothetical protein